MQRTQKKVLSSPSLKAVWDLTLELTSDIVWDSDTDVSWESKDGTLTITKGLWLIRSGTIWNGCSVVHDGPDLEDSSSVPVKSSNGKTPITWKASLIHDLGYTYLNEEGFPYNRRQMDQFFNRELKKANFKLSDIYYLGVRWFGKIAKRIEDFFRRARKTVKAFFTQ